MATLSKQKVNFKSNVLGEYAINLKIFGGNDKKTALGKDHHHAAAGMDI